MKKGDRVTRKNVNSFRYNQGIYGTIIRVNEDGRCYIKWDTFRQTTYRYYYKGKSFTKVTNQQHSTIQQKFLTVIN